MKLNIKDIIAIILVAITIIMYSSQYLLSDKLGEYQFVYTLISFILLLLSILYLYLTYLKK